MTDEIIQKSARANEVAKYQYRVALNEGGDAAVEALGGALMANSKDKVEGIASFREKRKPNFT
jgi:enoyl-CoA hydratase/carnithine racemase